MTYLLNNEPIKFKDLYKKARELGYSGARGGFWVAGFMSIKGFTVHEVVNGNKIEIAAKDE